MAEVEQVETPVSHDELRLPAEMLPPFPNLREWDDFGAKIQSQLFDRLASEVKVDFEEMLASPSLKRRFYFGEKSLRLVFCLAASRLCV